MLPVWTVANNYKLAEIEENITTSIDLPLQTLEGVSTAVISGNLPLGLRLENNQIIGTPFEVDRPVTSKFVIRATTSQGISDRTFTIIVQGPDDPVWITEPGRLPIGSNGVFFILDNSLIDFQLLATDPDLPAGDSLEFRLTGGELPPGITLTRDGRLTGIVDPLLALEINVVDGTYDRNPLDLLPYDFGFGIDPDSRIPRKLNREYFFRVTVFDNVSSVTRQFQIFVVGDDFARADNTIMKAADGVFTADFTFLRVPLWLTPSNLGIRRANNFLTIFLDAFDSNTIPGQLQYFLEPVNDDGSDSTLPPGMVLDSVNGKVAGRVPYQPAVTRDYKFTINAVRFNAELGLFTVFGTFLDDILANKTSTLRIGKVPRTVFNGLSELQSLVGRTIVIQNRDYQVISVNESNPNFDTITLDRLVEPINTVSPMIVRETMNTNEDFFFIDPVQQTDRNFYFQKNIRYSDAEIYRIDDFYPYIEWEIQSQSGAPIVLEDVGDSTLLQSSLESLLGTTLRQAYITVEQNNFDQAIKVIARIPATSQNRNRRFIKDLFESTDGSDIIVESVIELDRVKLNESLTRVINQDETIALGVTRGSSFNQTFSRVEEEVANKKKTFNIRLLGEVDSVITWLTPTNLGTLEANGISTLFVRASTTLTDSVVRYRIVDGQLPPGLRLSQEGEIIGKVPVFGSENEPGLLRFTDQGSLTTFDFGTTTFDREYTFTVVAKDRFEYSASERTFTIRISDEDNLNYSNIFFKPFLSQDQREKFINLVDDSRIFTPRLIYRAGDPSFGIQKNLRCLVYAGIENLDLESYVTAVAKNHKRKSFFFGDLKTAVAKIPGTDQVLYEVVYIELIDRQRPKSGIKEKINITSQNFITADSISYDTKNDNFVSNINIDGLNVLLNTGQVSYFLIDDTVETNTGSTSLNLLGQIFVVLNSGQILSLDAEAIEQLVDQNLLPDRYRPTPKANTIKADTTAITLDQSHDNVRYLSNISIMRNRIKNIQTENGRATTNRDFLPLWMRSPQDGDLNELGYVLALPIAYTKPGAGQTIKENIINTGFDFKNLKFEIDRYIIDSTKDNNNEQYILFANYQFNV